MCFLFALPIVSAETQVPVVTPADGYHRILTGCLDTESSINLFCARGVIFLNEKYASGPWLLDPLY